MYGIQNNLLTTNRTHKYVKLSIIIAVFFIAIVACWFYFYFMLKGNYSKSEYEKLGRWLESQVKSQENYDVVFDTILKNKKSAYTFSAKLFTGIGSS